MTSYLRYKQELRIVQDADDIESWITVRGNHIPIKQGQSKEDAVKSFLEKKGDNSSAKGSNISENVKKESKKQINENFEKAKSSLPKEKVESYLDKIGGINKKYDRLYSEASTKEEKEKILKEWSKNGNEVVNEMINKSKEAKPESSKKWSESWKPSAKQKQEAGFRLLEIGYNDVDFGKDPAKNKQSVLEAIKESGTENADYLTNIVKNMPDNSFSNVEKFRTGVKNAKKDFSEGSNVSKSGNKEQMPTSYQIEEAFKEVGLGHKWEHVKYRLDMHGIDQYTVKEFINSGLFVPEDIIEALESPKHDKIDAMVKKLKKANK